MSVVIAIELFLLLGAVCLIGQHIGAFVDTKNKLQ